MYQVVDRFRNPIFSTDDARRVCWPLGSYGQTFNTPNAFLRELEREGVLIIATGTNGRQNRYFWIDEYGCEYDR